MDNSPHAVEWAAPRLLGAAMVAGGIGLIAAAAASGTDAAGLVLLMVAAVLLLGMGATSLLVRPKLALMGAPDDADGIRVRGLRGAVDYPRAAISRIRVIDLARFGRRVPHLEFDVRDGAGDDRLIMLGRWDLGTDPVEVANALRASGLRVEERLGKR